MVHQPSFTASETLHRQSLFVPSMVQSVQFWACRRRFIRFPEWPQEDFQSSMSFQHALQDPLKVPNTWKQVLGLTKTTWSWPVHLSVWTFHALVSVMVGYMLASKNQRERPINNQDSTKSPLTNSSNLILDVFLSPGDTQFFFPTVQELSIFIVHPSQSSYARYLEHIWHQVLCYFLKI